MREESANPDQRVADVAARQHGIVTIRQLEAVGVGRTGVGRRVRNGRLHRVHRGVYAVGHRGLSSEGRWMAAVLACGDGAALSHRSAAELWGLLPHTKRATHVTTRGSAGRKHRGIDLHRSLPLTEGEITLHRGIAVTTPPRTLRDLPRVLPATVVRRARRQAEYLGLFLGETATDRTRSELEARFVRLCRRHRLPVPEVNVRVGAYTVDFLWRDRGLAVETDGYAAHRGRQAFLDDRARELELSRVGVRLRRFSDEQVLRDGAGVAAAVRRELGG